MEKTKNMSHNQKNYTYQGKARFVVIDMETWYDKEEDVLNVQLKEDYWKSIELPNGIVIDIAKDGSIAGIEILRASKVFSGDVKKVLEIAKKVQA